MDGVNWIPIQDGYDSRADDRWLFVYDTNGDGADYLYKKQDVDLFNTFSPGDEVMFRFRLYSDQNTVAWGWAVDEVYIQDATDNSQYNAWDDDHDADDAEVFFGLPAYINFGLTLTY